MSIFKSLICIVIFITFLYRWSISFNSYSGKGKPKMFGDYEAQRHWMEITYNLNIKDWYVNTTDNDLNYWGLDYPPLTAYHSFIMGYVANKIDSRFVKLHESRGIENEQHKFFMRMSVLVFDLIVFYPSVLLILKEFYFKFKQQNKTTKNSKYFDLSSNQKQFLISLLLILINPNIILIDHGHFQYNSISLGLTQLSIYFLLLNDHPFKQSSQTWKNYSNLILSSAFFCLSLNYKQMELYHALPIFFYLLGICIKSNIFKNGLIKLVFIGSTVIITFLLVWLPFVLINFDSVIQVLTRIFPIKRGLFEDKVANFWCSISVLIKLKEKFTHESLAKMSFLFTLAFNLPCCLNLLLRPSRQRFILALVNSSLAFYLFSFQVHEKSILLATVPACLLVNYYPLFTSWFILIANFSMLPLLIKDGLVLAFIITSIIFIFVVYVSNDLKNESDFWPSLDQIKNYLPKPLVQYVDTFFKILLILSFCGMIILTTCILFIKTPSKLPDLWTVLICVYSCVHFMIFFILFNIIQFTLRNEDLFITDKDFNLYSIKERQLFNFENTFTKMNGLNSRLNKKLN